MPSRFPNLLVNGVTGIAVGMATNIPPHNLREVINAIIALISDPDKSFEELMEYIKGPDFPTGGIIMGRSGIRSAYATGKGKITLRARAEIEEDSKGKSLHYRHRDPLYGAENRHYRRDCQSGEAKNASRASLLSGTKSDREGMRLVLELKRDAVPPNCFEPAFTVSPLCRRRWASLCWRWWTDGPRF